MLVFEEVQQWDSVSLRLITYAGYHAYCSLDHICLVTTAARYLNVIFPLPTLGLPSSGFLLFKAFFSNHFISDSGDEQRFWVLCDSESPFCLPVDSRAEKQTLRRAVGLEVK